MLGELAFALAVRFVKLVRGLFGERLVSAAVFGSLATGRFNRESDIDVLLVVEGLSGTSMARRIGALLPVLKALYDTEEYRSWASRVGSYLPDFNPVVYTPEEVRRHPPLMLDLVHDAAIVLDRGFLVRELDELRRRLLELGARRVELPDGHHFWVLKDRVRFGEVIEL